MAVASSTVKPVVPGTGQDSPARSAARPKRGIVARTTGLLSNGLVQAVLAIVALLWLTPTLGLLVASLRSSTEQTASGWWTALLHPGQLSFANYSALLGDRDMSRAFLNTVLISVPSTVLVVVIASL